LHLLGSLPFLQLLAMKTTRKLNSVLKFAEKKQYKKQHQLIFGLTKKSKT
jgi:hypothetical protein